MVDINKLEISNNNKEILSNYQTYLLTVKLLNSETTIDSYILDIYKYLEYLKKDYHKTKPYKQYRYNFVGVGIHRGCKSACGDIRKKSPLAIYSARHTM